MLGSFPAKQGKDEGVIMKNTLTRKILGVVTVVALSSAGITHANSTLTFDDFTTPDYEIIPDGYGGLNWDKFHVTNKEYRRYSGFNNGTVSGSYSAFNTWGDPSTVTSDELFSFHGAYLTAAWNDGLNIDIGGYLNGDLLHSRTVIVDTSGPVWFDFNYNNIDKLHFVSYGGIDAGTSGAGEHFVMDDFKYSVIHTPVPGAVILGSLGVCLVGWLKRRRII